MKTKLYLLLILISLLTIIRAPAQTYHPLPTQNAYWTVYEWDENRLVYDDLVYTVDGDTLVNSLTYTKVYRLTDHPTIYDTIRNLHCLMRQDVAAKKIWFIRSYLGETIEKLGYDLSVNVGDTVSLPAFKYAWDVDSLYVLMAKDINSVGLLNGTFRTYYAFVLASDGGHLLGYIEGIGCFGNAFPDRYYYWDPFHQSFTMCMHENGNYLWPANTFPVDTTHCGFNLVGTNNLTENIIKLYPNPANNYCVLELPKTTYNAEVSVLDLLGKPILWLKPISSSEFVNLDVSKIPSGIYLLTLKTPNQTFTNKLIIQH